MSTAGGNALPATFEITYDEFLNYRDDWILWRNLGHVDSNGTWVAPVSFTEAQKLPTRMMKVFFTLDDLTARTAKQKTNKGKPQ